MMNNYFEILPGVTTLGRDVRYVGIFNVQPGENTAFQRHAFENSSRWWIENSNGVTEMYRTTASHVQWHDKPCDPKEFTWIKLRCYNVLDL